MVDKNKKKDIQLFFSITVIAGALLFLISFTGYQLWLKNQLNNSILILLFLMIAIHYMSTMSNQNTFYGYFQSWEWKPFWQDNDLRRSASEHNSIIKSTLINCIIVIPLVIGIVYALYHYKLLNFYAFNRDIYLANNEYYDIINGLLVQPFYWHIFLGFSILFYGLILYFFVYKNYPSYNDDNTPLYSLNAIEHRKANIRDMYSIAIIFIIVWSFILSTLFSFLNFVLLVATIKFMYSSRIYWLLNILWIYPLGCWLLSQYPLFNLYNILIAVSIICTIIIIVTSLGTVIWSWIFRNKNIDSIEYDKLNKIMKPCLGFNSNFISESYINGELKTFNELYEVTHAKKKWIFWVEYFFANILNRNILTLLSRKNLLWLKVIFNSANGINSRSILIIENFIVRYGNDEAYKELKNRKPNEILPTTNKPRIEDPEGDVFLSLELEKEKVQNTNPSIWTVFYTTGIIYLTIFPYFVVYNAVMLVVFTKLIDILYTLNIGLVNSLLYGFVGVQGLIFLWFLLSIFTNNMGVWLAWKKYHRLKKESNDEALFFSIFKQRVIYQHIYEYDKNEHGEVITNNFELGLYPQINIELIDEVAKELSPKYYKLYSAQYPLYKK